MPALKVSFYDKTHKQLLQKNSPKYTEIVSLVEKGFQCTNEDLWTYGIFREQKNVVGFRDWQELKDKFPKREQHIRDYFDFDNATVRAKYEGSEAQDKMLTEMLGIGAGLAIVSHIHNLIQADWNLIPVSREKDLDFSIASDAKVLNDRKYLRKKPLI